MSNSWFKYEERTAERLSEFVGLILDTLKAPYLFRGHADLDWELEPAIDRSDFSGLQGKLERETHERLVFAEFKRLAPPTFVRGQRTTGNSWRWRGITEYLPVCWIGQRIRWPLCSSLLSRCAARTLPFGVTPTLKWSRQWTLNRRPTPYRLSGSCCFDLLTCILGSGRNQGCSRCTRRSSRVW